MRTSLAVAACVSAAFVAGLIWFAANTRQPRESAAAVPDLATELAGLPAAPGEAIVGERAAAQARNSNAVREQVEQRTRDQRARYADVEIVEVWVQVVEHGTQAPLDGACVARQRGALDPPFVTGGFCDANGWLRLRIPPRDESAYSANGPAFPPPFGYALFTPQAGHEAWTRGQVIDLERAASLVVTVATPGERKFSGVQVRATIPARSVARDEAAASAGLDGTVEKATDERGRAKLESLPPNAILHLSCAMADWSGLEEIEVPALAPGEERELTWLVADALDVTGQLVDENDTPLGASEVWLMPRNRRRDSEMQRMFEPGDAPLMRATTDGSGRFRFSAVALGDWWIGPGAVDGYAHDRVRQMPAIARAIEVVPRAQPLDVVIRVEHGQSIAGRVEGALGATRASVWLRYWSAGAGERIEPTRDDGSFEFGPLARGTYRLIGVEASSGASSEPIQVDAGTRDVVLRVGLAATIRGQTIDASSGAELPSQVWLMRRDEHASAIAVRSTAAAPSFELPGIEAGTYDLIARGVDGCMAVAADVALVPGDVVERKLELRRCARMRLTNWADDGSRYYRVRFDGAVLAEGSLSPGDTAHVQAPPGHSRIEVSPHGKAIQPVRELELASGDEVEVELGQD